MPGTLPAHLASQATSDPCFAWEPAIAGVSDASKTIPQTIKGRMGFLSNLKGYLSRLRPSNQCPPARNAGGNAHLAKLLSGHARDLDAKPLTLTCHRLCIAAVESILIMCATLATMSGRPLFDHLVGEAQQRERAERLGGLEVDDEPISFNCLPVREEGSTIRYSSASKTMPAV
jgi:hypothetical protein